MEKKKSKKVVSDSNDFTAGPPKSSILHIPTDLIRCALRDWPYNPIVGMGLRPSILLWGLDS